MVIDGLASLITANTEIGVKQCLPLTDDADPAQRIVFAHVFARVVAKGIQFEPHEAQSSVAKQSKLCEVCSFILMCNFYLYAVLKLIKGTDVSICSCDAASC